MRRAILIGLAFGAGAVHLAVVGVLLMLHQRAIIVGCGPALAAAPAPPPATPLRFRDPR